MPQITDIKPQKKPGRFNVYLNGQYAFSLTTETLFKTGLKIDQEISEEKIEQLVKDDDFVRVYDYVLKYLSLRPRSVKEINDWFRRKGTGEETRKQIIKKLEVLGYLNDEEFVKWWLEQRDHFHPSGSRLLTMELRQKGISDEIIKNAIELRWEDNPDRGAGERDLAQKVVDKKIKILASLPGRERKQKLIQALLRRGFSWDIIKEVLPNQLVDEEN